MPSAAACVARGRTKLELAKENIRYQRRAEKAEAEVERLEKALREIVLKGDRKASDFAYDTLNPSRPSS